MLRGEVADAGASASAEAVLVKIETTKIVAVMVTQFAVASRFLAGVHRFVHRHRHWKLRLAQDVTTAWEDLEPDGVIGDHAFAAWQSMADAGVPAVSYGIGGADETVHRVMPDGDAIGRLALQHLREKGVEHVGLFGSHARGNAAHRELMAAAGRVAAAWNIDAHRYMEGRRVQAEGWSLNRQLLDLRDWLQNQPLPFGVFVADVGHALRLNTSAEMAGLNVPDDVLLLAVSGDATLCEMLDPPLTAVQRDEQREGYEAAALLDRLMQGEATDPVVRVPPPSLIARRSTDYLGLDDELVRRSIRYIAENLRRSSDVEDVAAAMGVSRGTLYRRFMQAKGQSPRDVLRGLRLEAARQKLRTSKATLAQIAASIGYGSVSQLSRDYKKHFGHSPSDERAQAEQ